jgi:hypothetical protein
MTSRGRRRAIEEVAGDVALEGAECLALGLAFADPSVE